MAVCAVLALAVLLYVGRLAAAIVVGLAARDRHPFDARRYAAAHEEVAAAVRALTAAEAAAEAERLLASSEYLVTETGPVAAPASLARRQRELLRRFRSGSADGHVELVTPVGEERVLEVEDGAVAREHPTIDHLLVYLHRDAELYVECSARAV